MNNLKPKIFRKSLPFHVVLPENSGEVADQARVRVEEPLNRTRDLTQIAVHDIPIDRLLVWARIYADE